MQDKCGREIHYLRLSITDKCNLRCRYCMPDGVVKCSHEDILSYEEMFRIVGILSRLGIDTVRVTGGEPLIRKDVEQLIHGIKQIKGIKRVSMTTNGVLLAEKLELLMQAGLDAVNISLDTLNQDRFRKITGFDKLDAVLESIDKALAVKMPVKINCVPQAGVNEDELFEIAMLAKDKKMEIRFIEMMPVGQGKRANGISNDILKQQFEAKFGTLRPVSRNCGDGPAVCYHADGFAGEIAFISAMHGKFCSQCNRIRLTSQGFLKECLASNQGVDVRELLRNRASDDVLEEALRNAIYQKPSEHHFDIPNDITEKKDMYSIGG